MFPYWLHFKDHFSQNFSLSTVLFILPQALRGPKGLQGLQGRSGGPAAECADTRLALPLWSRNCFLFQRGGEEFLHDFFTLEGYLNKKSFGRTTLKVKIKVLIPILVGGLLLFAVAAGAQELCKVASYAGGVPVEPDSLYLDGVVKAVRFVRPGPELRWCKAKSVVLLTLEVMDEACEGERAFFLSPEIKEIPRVGQGLTFGINKNECREGEIPVIISIIGKGEGRR